MGSSQLWFWYGRAAGNLKVDPYEYQFLKKKWPIHIPIDLIMSKILTKITIFFPNFLKFEQILAQIGETLKINPFKYQILHKGSLIQQEDNFAPMFAACPQRVFCTEYPLRVLAVDQATASLKPCKHINDL